MFTEQELRDIHKARLAGEISIAERQAYFIDEDEAGLLSELANYATFDAVPAWLFDSLVL